MKLLTNAAKERSIVVVLGSALQTALASDIHRAAEREGLETVTQLLNNGTPIDKQIGSSEAALYLAAKKGHGDVVKVYLDKWAD